MNRSVSLGKIFGIKIGLHYSWFFIFALLAYALSVDFFPHYFPDLSKTAGWFVGIASSLLLFCSVLFHELAHSLVAKKNKIKVDSITLFFFGGIAQIREKKFTPQTELKIAIAGPVFSVLLGILFWILLVSTANLYITAVSYYLFRINMILAAFNMVPGYPLDGGRVLRALVWGWTGDIKKATKYAAGVGKAFAILLTIVGFFSIFVGDFGGIWLIMLGIFLLFIAKVSYEQTIIKETLSGLKVGDMMKKKFRVIKPSVNIQDAIKNYFLPYEQENFPIVQGKTLMGVVNLSCVGRVPRHLWKKVKVSQVAIPSTMLKIVKAESDAYSALIKMSRKNLPILLVIKEGELAGILDRATLSHYLKVKIELSKVKK